MRKDIYRGYSSFEFEKNGTFSLKDIDLVKMDLLNHIFTRRGERIRMVEFGTTIPDLLFEPLTEDLLAELQDELVSVIDYDPRVELVDLSLIPNFDNNEVFVNMQLLYLELDTVDELALRLQFDQ